MEPSRHTQSEALFVGIGAAMAETRDYANMMAAVIDVTCRALGAASGGFMRLDTARNELVLQAPAFGVSDESRISQYRTPLDQSSNAARVFLSREAHISNNAQQDPRFIQRFLKLFDTRNTLTVPLILSDRPIGIFHAINKAHGDFTEADKTMLLGVAPLLASCLQLAMMFRAFEHERRQFERSMTVHEQLLDSAAVEDGSETLCRTLASLLHRPLLLLDGLRRPLVAVDWRIDHSLVARELANAEVADGELRGLQAGDGGQNMTVLGIPVARSRGGYLVTVGEPGELDPVDRKAIQQSATLIAVEIFKRRSLSAAEHRAAGAALIELFSEGLDEALAKELLVRIGVDAKGPWRLALLDFHEPGNPGSDHLFHEHASALRDALERALGNLRHSCRLLAWRSSFLVVASKGMIEQLSERARVRALQNALKAIGRPFDTVELRIGISRIENDARRFGACLRGAEQALAAMARMGARNNVLRFEDLGVHRLLLGTNDPEEQAAFVDSVFEPLKRSDSEKKNDALLQTLRVLAGHNFNLSATAKEMKLHLNTVKYRVGKMRDLYRKDPASGDLRLEIELAIRIEAMLA